MSAEGNTGKGHFPAMQVAGEVETGSRHFFLLEVITGAVAYLPFRGQGKVAVDTHHLLTSSLQKPLFYNYLINRIL